MAYKNVEDQRENAKRWRVANPEKTREIQARSRDKHRERRNATARERASARPAKVYAKHLKRRYKLAPDDYERMLDTQKGVCAICGQPETMLRSKSKTPRPLSVDHDHQTGKVRGLLCHRHNYALGFFNDDPALLRAAVDYLEAK